MSRAGRQAESRGARCICGRGRPAATEPEALRGADRRGEYEREREDEDEGECIARERGIERPIVHGARVCHGRGSMQRRRLFRAASDGRRRWRWRGRESGAWDAERWGWGWGGKSVRIRNVHACSCSALGVVSPAEHGRQGPATVPVGVPLTAARQLRNRIHAAGSVPVPVLVQDCDAMLAPSCRP
ncbi:hypothetical protein BC628DRAFT_216723 [Trametes gibbosa]|nr:hypothetical protein BC628DRAFT_216723 [Trametes gibbosa]